MNIHNSSNNQRTINMREANITLWSVSIVYDSNKAKTTFKIYKLQNKCIWYMNA